MEDLIRDAYPQQEKIFYLKKYLGGAARKALEGFFYSSISWHMTTPGKYWMKGMVIAGGLGIYQKRGSYRFHVFVANRVQMLRDRTDPDQ